MTDEEEVYFDDLDKFNAETTRMYPQFPEMMAAGRRRRDLVEEMRAKRLEAKLSQTKVGASMETSQSAVARFENEDYSPNLNTLEKYAYAIGCRIEFKLVPIPETSDAKKEVSRAG